MIFLHAQPIEEAAGASLMHPAQQLAAYLRPIACAAAPQLRALQPAGYPRPTSCAAAPPTTCPKESGSSDQNSTAPPASSTLEFSPALLLFFVHSHTSDEPTRTRQPTRDPTRRPSRDRIVGRDDLASPAEWYNSLPPISKAFGTLCVFTATLVQLQILSSSFFALYYPNVFKNFEIWKLFTTFFFVGEFSINFGIRLLTIARYGVQLEKGTFQRRTADFLWMMIFSAISLLVLSAIPYRGFSFLRIPMVSMLLYVWSRETSNAQIDIYGIILLKSFYLPWVMLALDVIFGSRIIPGLMGIMVGHLYYFAVLHPLATGENFLKTPKWVHWIVARFRIGVQANTPVRLANNGPGAFRGRSYRLNQD